MDGRVTRRARGEAITEFVFLAPIVLLIIFGIFELGRVVDAWIVIHNAAREGARVGVSAYSGDAQRNGTLDDYVAQAAGQAAGQYLQTAVALPIRRDWATTPDAVEVTVTADDVTVTTNLQIEIYTPVFKSLLGSGGSVPVRASTTMLRQ